jgi:hypothetical protein
VKRTTLGLVGVCVVAVAAWAASTGGVAGRPAEAAAPARWECAELRVTTHPYWNAANTGEDEPKPEVVLHLPDKSHKSETFAGLALGRKVDREAASAVLGALGQDGWEPAGFAATEWVNPGRAIKRVEVWALKRPARK